MKATAEINLLDEIIVDNFAGGGGASTGIELATGRPVTIAINHDPAAILMHQTNHPFTEHIQASVWDVDPKAVCAGRPVGLAWFSPDCKHFSKAKGAALVDRNIRGLAWIVLRWAGTVRPRVILLENVEEFQTWGPVRKGKPVKSKSGQTFQKWKRQLADLGYAVEHKELIAADYGAPTTRKRFVLIARCDGKPIVWPEPTHSKDGTVGKKKWVSAAEIIDWSLPCYSVFATRQEIKEKYGATVVRPLADNTMRRVIRGVDKFTIRSGKPFIVECNHSGGGHLFGTDRPHGTITAKNTSGICKPVIAPFIAQQKFNNAAQDITSPLTTITAVGAHELSCAQLIQYHTEQSENVRANGVQDPLPTVDASNRYGLTTAHLVEYYGNGQPIDVREPLRTVVSHDREALTAVHIAEFKGQDKGQDARLPLRTVTAGDGQFAECRTVLVKAGTGDYGRWPEIRTQLNKHCDYSLADDEILLLIIGGVAYYIYDILLRMLSPRELYAAMGFPPDYIIDRDYRGNAYNRGKQVARCGNAVCPPMAAAVVRANMPEWATTIITMADLMNVVAI